MLLPARVTPGKNGAKTAGMVRNPLLLWTIVKVPPGAGVGVGVVVEERQWLGHAHDRPTFTVAHDPTGGQREAAWTSAGHPSPTLALSALVDHLERR